MMSDATVTIRGVDSETWKEFQTSIVSMHGNLYGNVGEEVTNALNLWLEKYQGRKSVVSIPADRLSLSQEDIGGLKEEAEMMKKVVEMPLKHPELFKWLNLIPTKGVLIYGPRGTGKNLLAKVATARANANLYILNVQRVLAEPKETELRAVFEAAKKTLPSVILIPDLETFAPDSQNAPAADLAAQWLLSEMDALEDFGQVVVIGIASSPNKLQKSLMERFRERIEVRFPNRQGRYEILKIITKKMPLDADVDLGKLADMTDGYQGFLLWKVCQEAAKGALQRTLKQEIEDEKLSKEKLERIKVNMEDFAQAAGSIEPEAAEIDR